VVLKGSKLTQGLCQLSLVLPRVISVGASIPFRYVYLSFTLPRPGIKQMLGPKFIKSKNEEVTEIIVRAATVGMKEADTSVNSVLNNLFAPMSQKRAKDLGLGDKGESKYVGRLSQEVDGSGRVNGIAIGRPLFLRKKIFHLPLCMH
jgi:hypothetical protein